MSDSQKVSVIINNYNYGRFLNEAIDSALNQTYPNIEVIVVDDGSTDNSRDIIAEYGNRIIPVLKENGGQASAFNAGFNVSHGDVVIFLDSDDMLLSTAVETAVSCFQSEDIIKVHWLLWEVDVFGRKTGKTVPNHEMPEGNVIDIVLQRGPESFVTPPTSGNAWARIFLEKVLPISEEEYKICADSYLFVLALIFGSVKRVQEPQGYYRVHGQNNYWGKTFDEQLSRNLWIFEQQCLALAKYFQAKGTYIDPEIWRRSSWFHRLHTAIEEIKKIIKSGDIFVLIDDEQWGNNYKIADCRAIPFLERDGKYWGPPPDDETAIREFERLRKAGANFIVFAWTAFWWLEHYQEFYKYLRTNYRCVLDNERLVVFDCEVSALENISEK